MNQNDLERLKEEKNKANAGKAKEHPAGTGLGSAGGALAGAAIGSLGGPVGAFVGAAIGAIAGGNTGFNAAEAVEKKEDTSKEGSAASPKDGPSEFDLPAEPPKNVRDSLDEGGFSSAGQRQRQERKETV